MLIFQIIKCFFTHSVAENKPKIPKRRINNFLDIIQDSALSQNHINQITLVLLELESETEAPFFFSFIYALV